MAEVRVWSEVDPALTSYTDCTYCSILMVIVASGFTAFPLGVNTHAERDAFRAGSPILNFAGGVDRAKARYGITVQSPTPYSKEGLRAALMQKGRAYAIAGRTANFPAGHTLRRWDPAFSGTHAIAYIPDGGGGGQWLDPLADMGYAGQNVSVSQVVDTFCHYPNDARYLEVEADLALILTGYTRINPPATTKLGGPANFKDAPKATANTLARYNTGDTFAPEASGPGEAINGNATWYVGLGNIGSGKMAFGFIHASAIGPLAVAGGFTQAQLDAAVAKAAMDAKVAAVKAGAEAAAKAAADYAASLPKP